MADFDLAGFEKVDFYELLFIWHNTDLLSSRENQYLAEWEKHTKTIKSRLFAEIRRKCSKQTTNNNKKLMKNYQAERRVFISMTMMIVND